MSVLEVLKVRKSYGKQAALDGASILVEAGEFVALLGPNGAGKTTLFQLLSGLFVADEGSIRVAGCDYRNSPVEALAQLGIVFQQPTLDLDLTVRANLMFHARLHGLGSKGKLLIDESLQRFGITDHANKPCRSLSGGNRRKVELARALLHKPSVLLMDEATVGLDPASRRQLLNEVHGLCASEGLAVLWSTHLVDEADRADRVVVLHQGKVLGEGTGESLRQKEGTETLADAFLQMTGVEKTNEETTNA